TLNFDASGNRTSVLDGTTTSYTVNNLNEYVTITGVAAPTYDNNGNLLTHDGWTYTYDAMNRLTNATNGATTAAFWYDGLNRQIARSATGSSAMITVMDGWNTYAEYVPASTTPSERLIYGAGGDLAKSLTNSRNYYPDSLGSTSHVATAVGGLLEAYSYDLNGTPTYYNASGTVLTGGTAYGITRLFTGQQWHAQAGLYNLRNRFYKPELGRFIQPDPIGFAGDPANLYRYCGNNPVNWRDPYGLKDDEAAEKSDAPKKHHETQGTSSGLPADGSLPYYPVPASGDGIPTETGGGINTGINTTPSDPALRPGSGEPFPNPGGTGSLFGGAGPRGGGSSGGGRLVLNRQKLSSFGPSEGEGANLRQFATVVNITTISYLGGVALVPAIPSAVAGLSLVGSVSFDAVLYAGAAGYYVPQATYQFAIRYPGGVQQIVSGISPGTPITPLQGVGSLIGNAIGYATGSGGGP
nr:RHS repeat-associated core domain-containing protein [Chthoniobacterales bacterium]